MAFNSGSSGSNSRNTVPALILIGLGILFLIAQVSGGIGWLFGTAWPLLILLPGLLFFGVAFFGDRHMAGFFFPGTIVTGIGAILLFQNVTDRWESWAYVWALIPAFVGLALMLSGNKVESESQIRAGRGLLLSFGIVFLVLTVFFELFIFAGNAGLAEWILPVALICMGLYLFFGGRNPLTSGDKAKNE